MPVASDSFSGVDLSRLPAPAVVETLDFEATVAALKASFLELCTAAGIAFDADLESDPVVKLIELFAYRELALRQRVNDAARAVMPAFATGADLDNLAALYGIERFIITPADPFIGTPAVLESDADFRRRMVLAPEGYSVAGPGGAYIFHALSASADVLDASVDSPTPGEVIVSVLSRTGSGAADADILDAVEAKLSADTIRPLTDHLTVQSAEIVEFAVEATLTFLPGPDRTIVQDLAEAQLAAHIADLHRLGRDVTRSGIIGALWADGIQNIDLVEPAADIVITRLQASYCTGTTLTDGGFAE